MIIFVLTNLLNPSLNLLLVIIKCFFKKKKISHQGALGRLGGVVVFSQVYVSIWNNFLRIFNLFLLFFTDNALNSKMVSNIIFFGIKIILEMVKINSQVSKLILDSNKIYLVPKEFIRYH